uniref:uncharacterized protein LOC105352690 n=1 Tax=Fragaria vesca subsp. vesca TaxID=101020 RepID=UPI0005C92B72|nr:PREDICTED: uncharacterized protein LOC105352690 [Fragaria vesca subsp. vesca]
MASSSTSISISQNTSSFPKLTETNYLVWVVPVQSYLNGVDLWGYVDGSIAEPSPTIDVPASGNTPASTNPNPAHKAWFIEDQKIVSILTTSLTKPVARICLGCSTSKAIWDCLANFFNQKSAASATNLKLQLYELQKGNQSVDAYLQHAKSIADALASIDQPVSDADLVIATLHGLGSDYLMLRTVLSQSTLPTFSDLYARILAFDAQQTSSPVVPNTTALFHNVGSSTNSAASSYRSGRRPSAGAGGGGHQSGKQRRSYGQSSRSGGFHTQPYQQQQQQSFPSYQPYMGFSQPNPWTQQQQMRPPSQPGILGPPPGQQWCPTCMSSFHGPSQCPHRFAGPNTIRPFAGAHFAQPDDPFWYPDTGATHHMTSMPVHNPQNYGGPHNVYMGNGDSMHVSHTGPL